MARGSDDDAAPGADDERGALEIPEVSLGAPSSRVEAGPPAASYAEPVHRLIADAPPAPDRRDVHAPADLPASPTGRARARPVLVALVALVVVGAPLLALAARGHRGGVDRARPGVSIALPDTSTTAPGTAPADWFAPDGPTPGSTGAPSMAQGGFGIPDSIAGPLGPLVPPAGRTGLVLATIERSVRDPAVEIVALDTGTHHRVGLAVGHYPGAGYGEESIVPISGGSFVTGDPGVVATLYGLAWYVSRDGSARSLGAASFALAASQPERAWLVTVDVDGGYTVRLVGPRGAVGVERRTDTRPIGPAGSHGLLLAPGAARAPSADGAPTGPLVVWDPATGTRTPVPGAYAPWDVLSTGARFVAWLPHRCRALHCEVRVADLAEQTSAAIDLRGAGFARDGTSLVEGYGPITTGGDLDVVDLATGRAQTIPGSAGLQPIAADGNGTLVLEGAFGSLFVWTGAFSPVPVATLRAPTGPPSLDRSQPLPVVLAALAPPFVPRSPARTTASRAGG